VHHPLVRAAGIDLAVVFFGVAAAVLTFFTGNGAPRWHNAVFAPIVFMLAAITVRLVIAEIRVLWPAIPDSDHRGRGVAELLVALVALVVVGPMLLIMPFLFAGAIT
jgi:hypothetical protein